MLYGRPRELYGRGEIFTCEVERCQNWKCEKCGPDEISSVSLQLMSRDGLIYIYIYELKFLRAALGNLIGFVLFRVG